MLQEKILSKLKEFVVTKINISGNIVKLQVQLLPSQNAQTQETLLKNLLPDFDVRITFFVKEETKKRFKKIIGVSSGKGGVGKSTVALHIAFSLKEMGYKVGILDADIYAPSIPVFLDEKENPISKDGRLIEPIETKQGFQLLSMGLFLKENQSPIWKGPMLSAAFSQFLEQGNWECDYLVIDFPPGTTDVHMACAKVAPDAQILLVGMPSKVVYADVMRMYVVLRALNLSVIGLVENMAYSICKSCGYKEEWITSWSERKDIMDVPKLMQLPIFHHFHQLNEDSYLADYKQGLEAEYFHKLSDMIIK